MEPQELNAMVKSIRNIENALGRGKKIVTHSEGINKKHVRKSIVALKEIDEGEIFSEKNITLPKKTNHENFNSETNNKVKRLISFFFKEIVLIVDLHRY